jgi:hypothetical protein
MRETILALSIFILPALYLSGLFLAVRQILMSNEPTATKALMMAATLAVFVIISLISLFLMAAMAGGYNH